MEIKILIDGYYSALKLAAKNLRDVNYDNNIYALDAGTGALKWKFHGNAVMLSPAVVNGVMYIGGHDGYFYVIE